MRGMQRCGYQSLFFKAKQATYLFQNRGLKKSMPKQQWRPVTTTSNNVTPVQKISSYINEAGNKSGSQRNHLLPPCHFLQHPKSRLRQQWVPKRSSTEAMSQLHDPSITCGRTTTKRTFMAFQNLQSTFQSTNNHVSVDKALPKYNQVLCVYSKTQTGQSKSPVVNTTGIRVKSRASESQNVLRYQTQSFMSILTL